MMISRSILCVLVAAACSLSSIKLRADDAVLVGGGYALQASQGQIELNVKWVQSILNSAGRSTRVYYTDGEDPAYDVRVSVERDLNTDPDRNPDRNLDTDPEKSERTFDADPLARVFARNLDENSVYHSHTIRDVSGSTQADKLIPALKSLFSDTSEDLLFVYNGHGAQSPADIGNISLMLWNNTRLPVRKLHELLEGLDPAAGFRYVFTQCYSGGFHRLIYKDPNKGLQLHPTQRCGFTAESAYRLAEGCSSSINTHDYRDYTTFFFAALSGQDRNGNPLVSNPDQDRDGVTTLREAHLYTLQSAFSTDLPRSSSEVFLRDWQPWYLRWAPGSDQLAENEYAGVYKALLIANQIADDADAVKSTRAKLSEKLAGFAAELNVQQELSDEMRRIQHDMQFQLAGLYPAMLNPYTKSFADFVQSQRRQAEHWVHAYPEYQRLVAVQTQLKSMQVKLLDQERQITQLRKILRMRTLANLKTQLYQYGSDNDIDAYESLLACEESSL